MKMMKKTFAGAVLLALATQTIAQNESHALTFSQENVEGSARFTALGGAFTALGGDPSATVLNPAGVAVYREGSFSLSATYLERFTTSDYYNQKTDRAENNLNIGSFAITGVQELKRAGKWRNTALSFGINRTMGYHDRYTLQANDVSTSIIDDYTNAANDLGVPSYDLESQYPFDLYLMWYNYLIDNYAGENSAYYNNTGVAPVDQVYDFEITGAKRRTYFNFGGNYDDKLYLGIGVELSNIRHEQVSSYSEYFDQSDTTTNIDEFTHTFYEDISGNGWSATAGAIYRPTGGLRLGLSVRTPEVMALTYEMESDNITVEDGVAYDVISPYFLDYRFRVRKPMEANLGVAYTIKKYGLISIEGTYLDYRSINMRGLTDSDPFTDANAAINNQLRPTFNFRAGGEWRVTPTFSVRGGFAQFGDPIKGVNSSGFQVYSAGAGYRIQEFYVDFSYQLKQSTFSFFPYDATLTEQATVQGIDHRFTLSFGINL